MNEEKRLRTRVPVQFEVSLLFGDELIRTETSNISLKGILCTSNPRIQNKAHCKVIISLSDDVQIVVDSIVTRVGEKESAISFIGMDDESFIHLRKLVEYNMGDAESIDMELHKQAFD